MSETRGGPFSLERLPRRCSPLDRSFTRRTYRRNFEEDKIDQYQGPTAS